MAAKVWKIEIKIDTKGENITGRASDLKKPIKVMPIGVQAALKRHPEKIYLPGGAGSALMKSTRPAGMSSTRRGSGVLHGKTIFLGKTDYP
jgi:hypothetical protein